MDLSYCIDHRNDRWMLDPKKTVLNTLWTHPVELLARARAPPPRERASLAMAATDRRNPNLDDFVGLNWSCWVDKVNVLTSDGEWRSLSRSSVPGMWHLWAFCFLMFVPFTEPPKERPKQQKSRWVLARRFIYNNGTDSNFELLHRCC